MRAPRSSQTLVIVVLSYLCRLVRALLCRCISGLLMLMWSMHNIFRFFYVHVCMFSERPIQIQHAPDMSFKTLVNPERTTEEIFWQVMVLEKIAFPLKCCFVYLGREGGAIFVLWRVWRFLDAVVIWNQLWRSRLNFDRETSKNLPQKTRKLQFFTWKLTVERPSTQRIRANIDKT